MRMLPPGPTVRWSVEDGEGRQRIGQTDRRTGRMGQADRLTEPVGQTDRRMGWIEKSVRGSTRISASEHTQGSPMDAILPIKGESTKNGVTRRITNGKVHGGNRWTKRMLDPRANLRPTEERFHGLAYDDPVDADPWGLVHQFTTDDESLNEWSKAINGLRNQIRILAKVALDKGDEIGLVPSGMVAASMVHAGVVPIGMVLVAAGVVHVGMVLVATALPILRSAYAIVVLFVPSCILSVVLSYLAA
ncbi:hypothetical protein [Arabidopsis thaliana]|uniref:Uncharacterized protein F1O3.4 n=1 Tax=Arabidopsis thaliana TaxID=3702 RepID=Q9C7M7_ARATH|nr:hypothetical protein [Arabidopsis thaliana]